MAFFGKSGHLWFHDGAEDAVARILGVKPLQFGDREAGFDHIGITIDGCATAKCGKSCLDGIAGKLQVVQNAEIGGGVHKASRDMPLGVIKTRPLRGGGLRVNSAKAFLFDLPTLPRS